MFTAALFITAKKGKPKCPSNEEQMNKMWYIHIMEYLFINKKEQSTDTGYNMDEP